MLARVRRAQAVFGVHGSARMGAERGSLSIKVRLVVPFWIRPHERGALLKW